MMIGETFGDFTILQLLGCGGMGKVYLAVQNSLQRNVALKIVSFDSQTNTENIERFLREAKIAASLQHPNIVSIYTAGKEKDFLYIAMEYIKGSSLESLISKGVLAEQFVWNIALQVVQALQTALQNGIIHRDIKPANILLTQQNVTKLTDFGLAKKMDDQSNLTHAGMIFGTPNYISPEQASGEVVDFRADIYSLGATIYHALTGNTVFTGKNILDVILKHKTAMVVPPIDYVPTLKRESVAIVGKMLQKKPEDRYQNYAAIISDITALLNNLPLQTAYDINTYSIYTYNPFEKGQSKTKKAFSSFFSFIPQYGKSQPAAILVTGWGDALQTQLKKHTNLKIQLITSIPELKILLGQNMIPVILDADYLGNQIVSFCDFLRENFRDARFAILVDSATQVSSGILPLAYNKDVEKLARLLSSHLGNINHPASQICLQTIVDVGKLCRLSWSLKVNEGLPNEGTIVLKQGEIVQARQKALRGDMAVHSLLRDATKWKLEDPTNSQLSRGTSGTVGKMASSSVKEGTSKVNESARGDSAITRKTVPGTKQGSPGDINAVSRSKRELEVTIKVENERDDATVLDKDKTQELNTAEIISKNDVASTWKVLVVDENQTVAEYVSAILSTSGNLMSFALYNPEDIFSLMNMEKFNLVVSKAEMTRVGGNPVYEEIQRIFPDTYQIVVGSLDPNNAAKIMGNPQICCLPAQDYQASKILEIIRLWATI